MRPRCCSTSTVESTSVSPVFTTCERGDCTIPYEVSNAGDSNAGRHDVVSATHGADTELLPLLTTNAGSLLEAAKEVVLARVAAYAPDLDAAHLEPATDMVVRVVLSHVMQPSAPPEKTGADLAWLAGRVLDA